MKPGVFILLLFAALRGTAYGGMRADSLLPVSLHLPLEGREHAAAIELQEIESGELRSPDQRKALTRLLPMTGPGVLFWKSGLRHRLFIDLARVSAKLRLYPLAMRCFYNACKTERELPGDSVFYRELPVGESTPVAADSLVAAFGDGREAAFYSMLLEIKQPVPGRRKAFTHINNVGHSFITLIKYNRDGSIVSRSFGFYPRKKGILSATPFHPAAPSVIKDDSRHEWDEAVGTLLSYRQFQDILGILQSYARRPYHLNHSNCTDFGLELARAGGISVWDATGRWPFGHGNNPGSAGQSVLEGKVGGTGEALLVMENVSGLR